MKLVVTIVGKDRVGIIATVSSVLAENNVNILNINQNIMEGFFNMVMIAEMSEDSKLKLGELQMVLKDTGEEMGLDIKAQHMDIFNVTHNV
jgi:ACT domain-containing protein